MPDLPDPPPEADPLNDPTIRANLRARFDRHDRTARRRRRREGEPFEDQPADAWLAELGDLTQRARLDPTLDHLRDAYRYLLMQHGSDAPNLLRLRDADLANLARELSDRRADT